MKFFEIFIVILIAFHAILMIFDEFFFHKKRILPKWERIGHPIDTLFILSCFFIITYLPMTKINVIIYCALSVFSCFIIIKDESIHLKCCDKYEQYLHAILFVLHPILLVILFFSWSSFTKPYINYLENFSSPLIKNIIYFQFISAILFLFYQILFWNFIFKDAEYVSKETNK
jgi:hypothetical protein